LPLSLIISFVHPLGRPLRSILPSRPRFHTPPRAAAVKGARSAARRTLPEPAPAKAGGREHGGTIEAAGGAARGREGRAN